MRLVYGVIIVFAVSWVFLSVAEAQTYKIYVQKMPPHWQKSFGETLDKAIQFWQQKNPGLAIEKVQYPDQADFIVEWASQFDSGKQYLHLKLHTLLGFQVISKKFSLCVLLISIGLAI